VTILALRALGIGDLATAVPALRGLHAAFPGRRLVLAAPGWLAPLAELTGAVDALAPLSGLDGDRSALLRAVGPGVVGLKAGGLGAGGLGAAAPAAGRQAPRLGPVGLGLAVNLHGAGPRSHRLLAELRPQRLIAFRCADSGHLDGPQWIEEEHEVARWCRLLDWYGIPADPDDLALRVPSVRPQVLGASIVHPGGKALQRRWPVANFARVARHLHRTGHRVVITGSPVERPLAAELAAIAGLPPERVLAGRTGVDALAALVAAARLVVSSDTGVAHLATAYGTPSVVLFGPVPPSRWAPPADRLAHRVLWHPASGLRSIRVPEVLDAVRAVLGLGAARTAATPMKFR
jgi:ADP-heptose:LPS heptosyltransferase